MGKIIASDVFRSCAKYYSQYRREYHSNIVDCVVNSLSLGSSTHALDLGCGTGQFALPLARRGIPVHAVDPDPDMLAEGVITESNAGISGIAWYRGNDDSCDNLGLPVLSAVIMGSSFHWMNREQTLCRLDRMIGAGGGVAVVSGGSAGVDIWSPEGQSWQALVRNVIVGFLGPRRRAGPGHWSVESDRHEQILARSSFNQIQRMMFEFTDELNADQIIGLQLSTSYASPALFGDDVDRFRAVLNAELLNLNPAGIFSAQSSIEVLLGFRGKR